MNLISFSFSKVHIFLISDMHPKKRAKKQTITYPFIIIPFNYTHTHIHTHTVTMITMFTAVTIIAEVTMMTMVTIIITIYSSNIARQFCCHSYMDFLKAIKLDKPVV